MGSDSARHSSGAGRPRDASIDAAIRTTAWQILADKGYEGLTFVALAEAAGCAPATIYRRYSSKIDLISSMLHESYQESREGLDLSRPPRDILIWLATATVDFLGGPKGPAIVSIFSNMYRVPELEQWWTEFQLFDRIEYDLQFRRLSPGVGDDLLELPYYSIVGCMIFTIGVRRRALTRTEIEKIVDAATSMLP